MSTHCAAFVPPGANSDRPQIDRQVAGRWFETAAGTPPTQFSEEAGVFCLYIPILRHISLKFATPTP